MDQKTQEILKETLKEIKNHREGEDSSKNPIIYNKSEGFIEARINGTSNRYWLVKENLYDQNITIYLMDGTVRVIQKPNTAFSGKDKAIWKRSAFAKAYLKSREDEFEFYVEKKLNKVSKIKNGVYINSHKFSEATDLKIRLRDIEQEFQYKSLINFLEEIERIDEQIASIQQLQESATSDEVDALIKEQQNREEAKKILLSEAQSYIREQAKLRYQPILDVEQENIVSNHIFDGTHMIISGGPGTGKTTSLIQRIGFLTDEYALKENLPNKKIPDKVLKAITNKDNPTWIFFSPSNLLYLYLKENMVNEGLLASDKTVKVFSEYKRELLHGYNLIKPGEKLPFVTALKIKDALLPNNGQGFKQLLQEVESAFIEHVKTIIYKVLKVNSTGFSWHILAESIKSYLKKTEVKNFPELIQVINYLQDRSAESSEITKSLQERLNKATATVIVLLKKNNEKLPGGEEPDDVDLDGDDIEETENNTTIFDTDSDNEKEFKVIKTLLRKYALSLHDHSVKINEELSKNRLEVIMPFIPDLTEVGSLLYFNKSFGRVTKGINSLLFTEITRFYKTYRKESLVKRNKLYNLNTLKALLDAGNNRLHHEEQSLLIGFINNLIKNILRTHKSKIEKSNHDFVHAFNTYKKHVIAIDEASDFCLSDIYAMSSFVTQDYGSINFSGDIMQRTTREGIRTWDDIQKIIPNVELNELIISYRQGHTLLNIASKIYTHSTGFSSQYKAYLPYNEKEPKPLIYINADENQKISWLAERIIDIYKKYGKILPSIAIFIPNEQNIDRIAELINEEELISDSGLKALACRNGQVLSTPNCIRIFDVKYIKGLEFEAVFFHDVDLLFNEQGDDLTFKNLYVGLSRATFFLGLTCNFFPPQMEFLREDFSENEKW